MILKITDFLTPAECAAALAMADVGRFGDGLQSLPGGTHESKHNEQLEPKPKQATRLKSIMADAFARSEKMRAFTQAKTVRQPVLSRYSEGMHYMRHLDSPLFLRDPDPMRADLSITVFLSDRQSYDGGALILETEFGDFDVKMPAGGAIVYATHFVHEVQKVTRGQRLALVTWVQSRIADPMRRQILYELTLSRDEIVAVSPRSEVAVRLHRSVASLTKLWSVV